MNTHVGDAELDAYADGEVEEARRRAIDGHVEACDACRAKVHAVAAMKTALARKWDDAAAPATLRARLTASLRAAGAVDDRRSSSASPANGAPRGAAAPRRVASSRPWARRGAALATLAAALIAAVSWWNPVGTNTGTPKLVVEVPDRAVLGVRETHAAWEREADPSVTPATSPASVAEQLSRALELNVLIPDFSGVGFAFNGGGLCEVSGLPAAHARYVRERPVSRLSFFTTLRNERMPSQVGDEQGGREWFVSRAATNGEDPTVVAWHSGPQTYAICAHLPREELIGMVMASKLAAVPDAFEQALLATATRAFEIPTRGFGPASVTSSDPRDAQAPGSAAPARNTRGVCLVKVGLVILSMSQLQ